jgi:uncharacterized protein YbaR (Trm112 family)
MLDQVLLEILACPLCKAPVRPDSATAPAWLRCESCGRRYPVRDGIPIMLAEEATLEDAPGGSPREGSGGAGGDAASSGKAAGPGGRSGGNGGSA